MLCNIMVLKWQGLKSVGIAFDLFYTRCFCKDIIILRSIYLHERLNTPFLAFGSALSSTSSLVLETKQSYLLPYLPNSPVYHLPHPALLGCNPQRLVAQHQFAVCNWTCVIFKFRLSKSALDLIHVCVPANDYVLTVTAALLTMLLAISFVIKRKNAYLSGLQLDLIRYARIFFEIVLLGFWAATFITMMLSKGKDFRNLFKRPPYWEWVLAATLAFMQVLVRNKTFVVFVEVMLILADRSRDFSLASASMNSVLNRVVSGSCLL